MPSKAAASVAAMPGSVCGIDLGADSSIVARLNPPQRQEQNMCISCAEVALQLWRGGAADEDEVEAVPNGRWRT